MSDYLSMDANSVRQQADSFRTASNDLSGAAGQWRNLLTSLGVPYTDEASTISKGFDGLATVVQNWSDACGAFADALTAASNSVQASDSDFAGKLAKVTFSTSGDLTLGGK
jgi:hypothetical protein